MTFLCPFSFLVSHYAWNGDGVFSPAKNFPEIEKNEGQQSQQVYTVGYHGRAFDFNGDNQFVVLDDTKGTCVTNPTNCHFGFTISGWVKFKVKDGEHGLLTSDGYKNGNAGISVTYDESTGINITVRDNSYLWNLHHTEIKDLIDKWVKLGVTWSQSNGVYLYFNGELQAYSTVDFGNRNVNEHSAFVVGKARSGNDEKIHFGNFTIDELKFWEVHKEEDEMKSDYDKGDMRFHLNAYYSH